MRSRLVGFAWLLSFPSLATAADRPRAFVGARIIPIEGDEIAAGVLVIEGGKIAAVGPKDQVQIPDDAEKIDVSGKVIMPGLICTHSHIGGSGSLGGADGSGPIQPGVRIYDSISVHDSGFKRAVAGGLTTLNIMPGSGHLISGQTVYVKLRLEPLPSKVDDFFILGDDGSTARRVEDGQRHQLDARPAVSRHTRQERVSGPRAVHQGPRVSRQDRPRRRRREQTAAARFESRGAGRGDARQARSCTTTRTVTTTS